VSWARLDDRANEHVKLLAAGAQACWLWSCGLMYANRQKARDGFVPEAMVPGLYVPLAKDAKRLAAKLVDVGLWEKVKGGFQIHDYHAINSTAAQHEAKKEKGRARAAKSYETRKVRGLLTAGDSSPGSSLESSREESGEDQTKNRDSSGVEWSGSGPGDSDLGSETGSTPPVSARGGSALRVRAQLWLDDPNRAALEAANPEKWPETRELVARLKAVFGGAEQAPRHSSDSRMRLILGHWAEGHQQSELLQAIDGAKLNDHIRNHPDLQTLQTILRDSGTITKYQRLLTVTPIAPVKANSRTVQPSQGENPYETAEVAT
jgi:hypothetical protein